MAPRLELVRMARRWGLTSDPIDTLDDVLVAIGRRPRGTATEATADEHETTNTALGQLVGLSRTDQLAGRVVLQRILPGLHAAVRRWRYGCRVAGVDPSTLFDELVAVAWDVIATYDVGRRPRNIASRLIRTTVDRTLIGPMRRRSSSEQPHDPDTFTSNSRQQDPSPSDELTELLTAATLHREADPNAIGLLCDLVRADGSTTDVAALHGVSVRTIRTRRADAVAHVRWLTQPLSLTG